MNCKREGLPVRVVRGAEAGSVFAPTTGFRYDGLYYVEDAHHRIGKSGFRVWMFTLRRDDPTPPPWGLSPAPAIPATMVPTPTTAPPPHTFGWTMRVVRNTALAQQVKEIHKHACQFCGVQLKTPTGLYAEGAHIKPLGAPHYGPDSADNILCLCPNHHVLFDAGAILIGDDLSLAGAPGNVHTSASHPLNMEYIKYHRDHYSPSA
jgi:putative restriction endonuclease